MQVVASDAKEISAGRRHSVVLKKDGSVWATGYNRYGQLGDGFSTKREVFVKVISGVKIIGAGAFHTMVLKEDGSIWATGSNKDGQFGDGSTMLKKGFLQYIPLEPFLHGVGYDHMYRGHSALPYMLSAFNFDCAVCGVWHFTPTMHALNRCVYYICDKYTRGREL